MLAFVTVQLLDHFLTYRDSVYARMKSGEGS